MVLSVVNLQEAYAKALLVDRDALAAAQHAGDVLRGQPILLDAYPTHGRDPGAASRPAVRDACAAARAALAAAEHPIQAHRASGYADRGPRDRDTQQELTR